MKKEYKCWICGRTKKEIPKEFDSGSDNRAVVILDSMKSVKDSGWKEFGHLKVCVPCVLLISYVIQEIFTDTDKWDPDFDVRGAVFKDVRKWLGEKK